MPEAIHHSTILADLSARIAKPEAIAFAEIRSPHSSEILHAIAENLVRTGRSVIFCAHRINTPLQDGVQTKEALKNLAIQIAQTPAIYAVDHYYLVALMQHAEEGTLDEAAVLCDEVHKLSNAAKTVYRNTFSPSHLKHLLFNTLKNDQAPKTKRSAISQGISALDDLMSELSHARGEIEGGDTERARKILREYREKLLDRLGKDLSSLLERDSIPAASSAMNELRGMEAILSGAERKRGIEISFSPVKGYPSFSIYLENPIGILRRNLAKHTFSFAGMSGTIRVTPSASIEENRWSFERIGFFPFARPENEGEKRFNERVANLSFGVYPSDFSREQARYYIADGERYKPPSGAKGEEAGERRYRKWVEALADLCKETVWGNTVVLMSSYENIELMREALNENGVGEEYEIFAHRKGSDIRQTVEEYKRSVDSGKKSLLVTAWGFRDEIELHGDYLNTLFVGKLPFGPVKYPAYGWAEMRRDAVLSFREVVGGAIRTPEDKVLIVVADPRAGTPKYRVFEEFLQEMAIEVAANQNQGD